VYFKRVGAYAGGGWWEHRRVGEFFGGRGCNINCASYDFTMWVKPPWPARSTARPNFEKAIKEAIEFWQTWAA
jgi:hypothetical protein